MINGAYVFAGRTAMRMKSKLWTIIRRINAMGMKKFAPIHPGEILMEEFLKPLGISQYKLSKDINVPPRRINEIVHGTRSVTADTALRLSRYFNLSERFWLNLQARYDLEVEKDKLDDRIETEVKVFQMQRA